MRMASPGIAVASADDIAALCRGLQAFNRPHVGEIPIQPVNLVARAADGALLGGILAEAALGWLVVRVLWVEPAARRQGLGAGLVERWDVRAVDRGAQPA